MSSKFEPQALCAGMRVGVEFLSQFVKSLKNNGGHELLLWLMALPKNAQKLEELAKFAVAQYYPIPRKLIEQLAGEESDEALRDEGLEDDDRAEIVKSDMRYAWGGVLGRFEVPVDYFEWPMIPEEISAQIVGQPLQYPHVITYANEPHIVISIYYEGGLGKGNRPHPGLVYDDGISSLGIVPAKYIDLDN